MLRNKFAAFSRRACCTRFKGETHRDLFSLFFEVGVIISKPEDWTIALFHPAKNSQLRALILSLLS